MISQGNRSNSNRWRLCAKPQNRFQGKPESSRWFTSGCLKGNSEINPWMNHLSWLFLGEGTPLGYHLSETVLKILMIVCIFLLRENRLLYFWRQSILMTDDLFLQIPAGDMHPRGSPFFYSVVSLARHFLILFKYLPHSQEHRVEKLASGY